MGSNLRDHFMSVSLTYEVNWKVTKLESHKKSLILNFEVHLTLIRKIAHFI